MNQNIKNMHRLTFLIVVFATVLVSCQKKAGTSSVVPFLSDFVEVEPYSPYSGNGIDQSYLKVIDGSNIYYFNNTVLDTIGFAVDTINHFKDKAGNSIFDTLWITKDYGTWPDTTAEGMYEVNFPVEQYDLGHNSIPLTFTYNVRKTISNGGSLDLSGDYTRNGSPVTITKISNGNFVLSNAFVPPRITPVMINVDASNKVSIPDVKTGFFPGSNGTPLTIRQAQFYNIRYSQIGGSAGAGDTLVVTVKRTDVAPAITKFIRQ
ncbi:MAG: hypothetical protein JWN78_1175 [Bacteroidota bacterium]|nr:hypothetical protein [Bacteroidota bacterium]